MGLGFRARFDGLPKMIILDDAAVCWLCLGHLWAVLPRIMKPAFDTLNVTVQKPAASQGGALAIEDDAENDPQVSALVPGNLSVF